MHRRISAFPTLARHISTTAKDHAAVSQCFQLTNRVTRLLERHPHSGKQWHAAPIRAHSSDQAIAQFESLLRSFRSNSQDDGFFKDNTRPESEESLGMVLSPGAVIIAVDTGGERTVTDVGFCIYDKQLGAVYKIQVDIRGRRLSRKGGVLTNLLARPLKLEPEHAAQFCHKLLHYYCSYKRSLGHDVCIIGHNLERDLKALRSLSVQVPLSIPKIDTDVLCREVVFSRGLNLRKLALTLGIAELKPFHPSVNDAYYTLHVLLRIVNTPGFQNTPLKQLQGKHQVYMAKLHRNLEKDFTLELIRRLKHILGLEHHQSSDKKLLKKIVSRVKRKYTNRDPTISGPEREAMFYSDLSGMLMERFGDKIAL